MIPAEPGYTIQDPFNTGYRDTGMIAELLWNQLQGKSMAPQSNLQELQTDSMGNVKPYQVTPRDVSLSNYLGSRGIPSSATMPEFQRMRAANLVGGTEAYNSLITALDPSLAEDINKRQSEFVYDPEKKARTLHKVNAPEILPEHLIDPSTPSGKRFQQLLQTDPAKAEDLFAAITGTPFGRVRHGLAEQQGRKEKQLRDLQEDATKKLQAGAHVVVDPVSGKRTWKIADKDPFTGQRIERDAREFEAQSMDMFAPDIFGLVGLQDNYAKGRTTQPTTQAEAKVLVTDKNALQRLQSSWPHYNEVAASLSERTQREKGIIPSPSEIERHITLAVQEPDDPKNRELLYQLQHGTGMIPNAAFRVNQFYDQTVGPEIENPILRKIFSVMSLGQSKRLSHALVPNLTGDTPRLTPEELARQQDVLNAINFNR